jgi:hypothetical protein
MKRIYYFLRYCFAPWDEGRVGIKSAWSVAGIIVECNKVK